ncbi:MAG: 2-iminobutanoate/2-iminopropanoate deaminase [Actinomycetota bacterium]|jgi:2-iminobutanoate/2-iminopropanoate deaminase
MSTPAGPYTPAVRAGELLFVSGQVGMKDGALVAGDTIDQLRQAFGNLEGVLAEHGAALTDVVKITVFLRHMSDFGRMNEAYMEVLGDHRPARTTIGVAELPLNALVEIEATAWKP